MGAAPAQQKSEPAEEEKTEDIRAKLNENAAARSAAPAKKRNLRPAVSSRDNKVEKTEQPLRIVRRSIKTADDNPGSLSKEIVEQLAVKIANSRVK